MDDHDAAVSLEQLEHMGLAAQVTFKRIEAKIHDDQGSLTAFDEAFNVPLGPSTASGNDCCNVQSSCLTPCMAGRCQGTGGVPRSDASMPEDIYVRQVTRVDNRSEAWAALLRGAEPAVRVLPEVVATWPTSTALAPSSAS